MALIKCKECGQMISEKATSCPICGNPVRVHGEHISYEQGQVNNPVYQNNGNRRSNKLLYGIIIVLLVALAGAGYYFHDKSKQSEKEQQEEQIVYGSRYYGQVVDPDGYTNIRKNPSTNAPIVRRYDSGNYLYYTPLSNGWSKVYSADKSSSYMGYMHTSRIKRVNPNSKPTSYYKKGYVVDPVDSYVNLRKGPNTSSSIVGRLNIGTDIYYIQTSSGWYKAYDLDYNYLGYIYYDRVRSQD